MIMDEYYKVLTENGVNKLSYYEIPYNSFYTIVNVKKLEIIKASNEKTPYNPQNIFEITDAQPKNNIYDKNNKVLAGNIRNLRKGDILHIVKELKIIKA